MIKFLIQIVDSHADEWLYDIETSGNAGEAYELASQRHSELHRGTPRYVNAYHHDDNGEWITDTIIFNYDYRYNTQS